jgi:hypothetical protein
MNGQRFNLRQRPPQSRAGQRVGGRSRQKTNFLTAEAFPQELCANAVAERIPRGEDHRTLARFPDFWEIVSHALRPSFALGGNGIR